MYWSKSTDPNPLIQMYRSKSTNQYLMIQICGQHPDRARQFFVSSDARCSGSFLTLSLFVLTHIGDRHVFYLLLMRFSTFSVQTQLHSCVLEKNLFPSCSIITSLAPSCNIRTRYSLVLPCFMVLALRPLLLCTWELHCGGECRN